MSQETVTEKEETGIKMVVATDRIRDFLSKAFLKKGSAPAQENVIAEITPKMLAVRDQELDLVAVHLLASKKLFKEFSVPEGETKICLTSNLFNVIDKRFKGDETLEISVKNKTISVVGKTEGYEDDILDIKKSPWELPVAHLKDLSVMAPKDILETCKVAVKIPVATLQDLPNVKTVFLTSTDKTLEVSTKEGGRYFRKIEIKESKKLEPFSIPLSGEYLDRVVSNLSEDVWLFITDGGIAFSKEDPELSTLFMMTSSSE